MALIFLIISNNKPQMLHPGSDGRRYLAHGLYCTGADGDHSRGRFRVSGSLAALPPEALPPHPATSLISELN